MPQKNEGLSIGDITRDAVTEMLAGDLGVRSVSVESVCRRSLLRPAVLVGRRMRARFQFVVTRREEKRWLFNLFGKEEKQRVVANLRLTVMVEPAPGSARIAANWGESRLVLPPFVSFGHTGNELTMDLGPAGVIRSRVLGNRVEFRDTQGHPLKTGKGWPVQPLVGFLDAVWAWQRNKGQALILPFRLDTGSEAGSLLSDIADNLRGIYTDLARTHRAVYWQDYQAGPESKFMPEAYRIGDLFGRVLLQLDGKGNVVKEDTPDEDWHQMDVEVRLEPVARGSRTLFSFRFPGFLFGGRYYRGFLTGLLERKAFEKLEEATRDHFKDQPEFGNLNAAELIRKALRGRKVLFVRLDGKDRDLLLMDTDLQDQKTRLLFLVRLSVTPFPAVQLKGVEAAVLLAHQRGDAPWEPQRVSKRKKHIQHFMARTIRAVHMWAYGLEHPLHD